MNNNRKKEIKKEDKKAFKGFVIGMILAGILGAFIGVISVCFEESLGYELPNFIINILLLITPFASLVLSAILIIVGFVIYKDSRKKFHSWNQSDEEEEMIDKLEEKLSYLILFTSVNLILGFFFFGAGVILLGDSYIDLLLMLLGFLLCIISCTVIQKKVVNLEKEINPMLNGSVYDFKFSQKWFDSCDEAIKLNIYKSSFKSYKVVTYTCLILWLVCVLGYSLWDFGIMPIAIITIIWLVQTVTYCLESIKCSKEKIN